MYCQMAKIKTKKEYELERVSVNKLGIMIIRVKCILVNIFLNYNLASNLSCLAGLFIHFYFLIIHNIKFYSYSLSFHNQINTLYL